MNTMSTLLQQGVDDGIFRPLDVQFARMVAQSDTPGVMLAAALTSRDAGQGHVCLPLDLLRPEAIALRHPDTGRALLAASGIGAGQWAEVLSQAQAVGDGTRPTPLVLADGRLYLNRLWRYEEQVGRFFQRTEPSGDIDSKRVRAILDELFTARAEIDWQKVAAAVALTRRISVISGGPGTGKTTTVARLLTALIRLDPDRQWRIRLAAPTGKAAARLTGAMGLALKQLNLDAACRTLIPDEAFTLHRLLGVQPHGQRLRYHAGNPLHLDLLVVDEASMVDLPMMSRLIDALPPQARVIFLGDRDQLASVEAGAVLGDVCHYASAGYPPLRARELSMLTGYALPEGKAGEADGLRSRLCLLRHSYRFGSGSGIGQLAAAVNAGDSRAMEQVLAHGYSDIAFCALNDKSDWQTMIGAALEGYRHYLDQLKLPTDPAAVLAAFGRYQLLCALREGPFGVTGLNDGITASLIKHNAVERPAPGSRWYHGRPVMITRNDSALGLFNGDIGVTLHSDDGLRVWFALANGTLKSVPPSRLPDHETAWAMTVHKSQGSEFDHVALVLPDEFIPLISRELVYTAITRARSRLTLHASRLVLAQAVATRTARRSGLTEALSRPTA